MTRRERRSRAAPDSQGSGRRADCRRLLRVMSCPIGPAGPIHVVDAVNDNVHQRT